MCDDMFKNNFIFKLARLGLNRSKNIPYLLIGVVWCFSSLILVITYTSLLTSYITAPSTQYLIKSVQELVDRPDMWIVTDKNRNSESLMLVSLRQFISLKRFITNYTINKSAKSGVLKDLGDKLRIRPNSTCRNPLQCANMVKSNPSCAYVSVTNLYYFLKNVCYLLKSQHTQTRDGYLHKAMADDFQETQKCNLEMGKEEIYTLRSPWALAKNSPYTEHVNIG